jgi:hypothetical protein
LELLDEDILALRSRRSCRRSLSENDLPLASKSGPEMQIEVFQVSIGQREHRFPLPVVDFMSGHRSSFVREVSNLLVDFRE